MTIHENLLLSSFILGAAALNTGCADPTSPTGNDDTIADEDDTDTDTTDGQTETDSGTDTGPEPMDSCQRLVGDGELKWVMRCGGLTSESLVGIDTDSMGNLFVGINLGGGDPFLIGEFEVSPGGSADILVVKFDPDGEALWVRHFDGGAEGGDFDGDQYIDGLVACGDDVVIRGTYSTPGTVDFGEGPLATADYFAGFDGQDGSLRWSREVELLTENAFMISGGMACDSDGNLAVTGAFNDGVDFGNGPMMTGTTTGFVARFDTAGVPLWSRTFVGGGSYPVGRAVTTTPANEVAIIGSFAWTIDVGGGPIGSLDAESVLVAKYDADGQHLWSQAIGFESLQYGAGIASDSAGNLAITGKFLGSTQIGDQVYMNVFPDANPDQFGTVYDGFIALLDPAGVPYWSTQVGSMYDDDMRAVYFDDQDSLFATGALEGEFTVREYDGDTATWETAWSSEYDSFTTQAAISPMGPVFVATTEDADVDLGLGVLPSHGPDLDLVIARYDR